MLDVLIVGAGISGLSAARELIRAGKKVLVLEGRSRLGGRALTLDLGPPIEFGPEFIHGTPSEFLKELDDLNLRYYRLPDLHHEFRGGRLSEIKDFWEKAAIPLKALRKQKPDRSFIEAIRSIKGSNKSKILGFVEGFDAAILNEVSANEILAAKAVVLDPNERALRKPLEGYGKFVQALAQECKDNIRTGHVVKEIQWRPNQVKASVKHRGKDLQFEARKLLLTVPVGVLDSIQIAPPLPLRKLEALSYLQMGPVVKLVLRFDQAFWSLNQKRQLGLIQVPKSSFHTWWTAFPMGDPVLTAWAGGDHAVALMGKSKDELVEIALRELATLFGTTKSKIRESLIESHFHDWNLDPFSKGAYSFVKPGGENARTEYARPVQGTLYFAGEATHPERNGTIDGAFDSGKIAVQKILKR